MAGGVRRRGLTRAGPARAWLALALGLAGGALVVHAAPRTLDTLLDAEPGRVLHEPWRLAGAAFVHYSGAHLAINLGGTALIAALGRIVAVPPAAAAAWALAWPLTHALLAATALLGWGAPLPHYGGLSGVLHAGIGVLLGQLLWPRALATPGTPALPASAARREHQIGVALAAAVALKLLLEAPWRAELPLDARLGIQVAPMAHACGVAAGCLAWSALAGLRAALRRRPAGQLH